MADLLYDQKIEMIALKKKKHNTLFRKQVNQNLTCPASVCKTSLSSSHNFVKSGLSSGKFAQQANMAE